jgi:hypothetical protein
MGRDYRIWARRVLLAKLPNRRSIGTFSPPWNMPPEKKTGHRISEAWRASGT